jgi:hypothetical protein
MADSPDLVHARPADGCRQGSASPRRWRAIESNRGRHATAQFTPVSAPQLRTGCSPSCGFPDKRLASHSLLLSEAEPKPFVHPGTGSQQDAARSPSTSW